MKNFFLIILLSFFIIGCTDLNKYSMFSKKQDLTTILKNKPKKNEIYRYKIKAYDRISVLFYEHPDISTRKIGDFQEDTVGILVNANGIASFPLIGDIKVVGMYIEDLENEVERLASEFIINPSVNLNILNHRLFVFLLILSSTSIVCKKLSLWPCFPMNSTPCSFVKRGKNWCNNSVLNNNINPLEGFLESIILLSSSVILSCEIIASRAEFFLIEL